MGNPLSKLTRREQYGLTGFTAVLAVIILGNWGCNRFGSAPLAPAMTLSQAGSVLPLAAESPTPAPTPQPELVVSVQGAVKKPGIYHFKAGQRFYEAIEKAGGFLPEARREALNLAEKLRDGDQLSVPTKTKKAAKTSEPRVVSRARKTSRRRGTAPIPNGVPPVPVHLIARPVDDDSDVEAEAGDPNQPRGESVQSIFKSLGLEDSADSGDTESSKPRKRESPEDGIVDINKADAEELTQLPGVGPVTADRIIQHRQENGEFRAPEDLMDVKGIGPRAFQKLKALITI